MKKKTTLCLVQAALIPAMYVALTYLSNMAGLWEVRFSEALCILPYFTGAAVPGLTVGCVLANILTGCPLWDVVFGSLATLIGAYIARLLHKKSWWLAPWPNIIANTIAVPLILRYVYTDVSSTYPALVGLIFASGTVIVFSDIPANLTAAQMIAACYQNGANAWLGGGVLGTLLGGNLLLLCGRPAANLVMAVLALCASLYIFDITPAECWQWLCNVGGGVHEKGVAVYEQNAARRAERLAARQAEEEYCAEEPADDYDDSSDEEDVPGGIPVPGWLSGVFSWGHKVTKEMEGEAEPAPVDDSLGYEPPAPVEPEPAPAQPAPAFEPVKVTSNHPRAAFDIDLGPDTSVSEGGSEPIEPIIIGPGGTFGQDPLQKAPPRAIVKPVVPDAVETAAEDFFAPAGSPAPAPVVNPTVPPAAPEAPAAAPAEPVQPEMPVFQTPTLPTTDEPVVPVRVSAENAVAMRSEPDEDGWISITSEPVEEKDLNTLVAAAMEKPAAGEQAAATAPAEEPEVVETFQYQYPSIELFEKSAEEGDPGAQDELKANAQKLVDTLESFGVRTRVLDISRGPSVTRYEVQPMAGVKISRITSLADDIALNLAVADVRMEAPIPGKPAVGIEVPNHKKTPVFIRSVFESQAFLRMTSPLGVALGKDIAGVAQVADLCKMPHLLIAGSTGSGKSVCVNSIIISILFRSSPEDVKLMLIDPKVVELAEYNGIPHLLMPVITEPRKAAVQYWFPALSVPDISPCLLSMRAKLLPAAPMAQSCASFSVIAPRCAT